MRRHSALWMAALAGDLLLAPSSRAQTPAPPDHTATYLADSLRLSGRPWHAAETLLAAARRDPHPNAFLIVEGAKAEVHAKRYEHARALLAGQPWLVDYLDGEALAVLAQAEFGVGRFAEAAAHFGRAGTRHLEMRRRPPRAAGTRHARYGGREPARCRRAGAGCA